MAMSGLRAGRGAPLQPAAVSERREHLDALAVLVLVVCCALWGLQQIAVKAILLSAPPLYQATLRSAGAALLVLVWSKLRGVPLWQRDGSLGAGLLAGALFAGEFCAVYLALPHTPASRLIVFLYLSPFVVALGLAALVPAERLTVLQSAGLCGAFAALAYAFQEGLALPSPEQLQGDALAILAAVLWGVTTLVVRVTRLASLPPEKTLFYQLGVSAVLLGVASWRSGEHWPQTLPAAALGSLAFQTVIVAFASYLAWFWLLRHYAATKVAAFSFLTPLFGLLFGWLLLGEGLSRRLALAMACVAVGIYLVNRKPGVAHASLPS